jgi:hypothetical protein
MTQSSEEIKLYNKRFYMQAFGTEEKWFVLVEEERQNVAAWRC